MENIEYNKRETHVFAEYELGVYINNLAIFKFKFESIIREQLEFARRRKAAVRR